MSHFRIHYQEGSQTAVHLLMRSLLNSSLNPHIELAMKEHTIALRHPRRFGSHHLKLILVHNLFIISNEQRR
jgi:hypothetical protein